MLNINLKRKPVDFGLPIIKNLSLINQITLTIG